MKNFEILEHSADLKIRAFGSDKEQLFWNMMRGMQASLRSNPSEQKTETKIMVQSEDLLSLLVDFLSEINYLNEINQEVYYRIKFDKFSDTELEAELSGYKVKRFGLQIKGVTFHDLDVSQKQDGQWEATVLFDI